MNSEFVSLYLNSAIGIQYLEKLFIGSTVKHINTSELAKHFILKPVKSEQDSICEKANSFLEMIKIEEQKLPKLHNLKHGLMQDLLTGRKRVKVEDELENTLESKALN